MANRSYMEDLIIWTCSKENFDNYLLSQWFNKIKNSSPPQQKYNIKLITILSEPEEYKKNVQISTVLKLQSYTMKTGEWAAKILWYHTKTGFWDHKVVLWNPSESEKVIRWKISDLIILIFDKNNEENDLNIIQELLEIK